ncbi:hypothetical protein F5146DRAFT_1069403 [Armillaria mellea]|nr:hypothetical protein F5146DRAFT_1069403 [Armillaria mellea]
MLISSRLSAIRVASMIKSPRGIRALLVIFLTIPTMGICVFDARERVVGAKTTRCLSRREPTLILIGRKSLGDVVTAYVKFSLSGTGSVNGYSVSGAQEQQILSQYMPSHKRRRV